MVINCKEIYEKLKIELGETIATLNSSQISIGIISFCNNSSSDMYIKGIKKTSKDLGINVEIEEFPLDCTDQEIFDDFIDSGELDKYDGVMIQLPIPLHLSIQKYKEKYKNKDIDGFGYKSSIIPATTKGVLILLNYLCYNCNGKNCVIIGRGKYLGQSFAKELLNKNCTTTVCHSFTDDLNYYTKHADIIISAVGKPGLITPDMVKPNSIIIDIGISIIDGGVYGDVSPECSKIANITSVPNGMGLMTRIGLIDNLLSLVKKENSK